VTAGPSLVDLDRLDGDLKLAWKAYQAAEDVQATTHDHDADARCTAVRWIPELAAHIGELACELRAARQVVEVARGHDCPDGYPLACAVDAYDQATATKRPAGDPCATWTVA
jgi:hypothetical protein